MKHSFYYLILFGGLILGAMSCDNPDDVICTGIANFLLEKPGAAVLSSEAKADLFESSWPEVQCEVEGMLDSPSCFKDLRVYKTEEGQYKYECICPEHGDKYVDCCTIHASLLDDGTVLITHVTWDDVNF